MRLAAVVVLLPLIACGGGEAEEGFDPGADETEESDLLTSHKVLDGTGADIDFQSSQTTISANWSNMNGVGCGAGGRVQKYGWAIGVCPGCTDVQPFVDVGLSRTATRSGLSLVAGQKYFVTVRATFSATCAVHTASDGVTIDVSGPTAGSVNDGTGSDIDSQTDTRSISANWSGFADPQSGIARYDWAIGTSPGGQQVLPFTSVRTATRATKTSLRLTRGTTYYVSVRATNGAGSSTVATSDGVLIQ
jgi:hypothetical protein